MQITLILLPGAGRTVVNVPEGTTVAQLVASQGLQNRQIVVEGSTVETRDYATTTLQSGWDVAALGNSKGA